MHRIIVNGRNKVERQVIDADRSQRDEWQRKIAGQRTALGRGLINGKPNVSMDGLTNVRYGGG